MIETSPFHLASGQTRPLSFRLSAQSSPPLSFSLEVIYVESESPDLLLSTTMPTTFSTHNSHSPHKITFLHPGGIVSYAILRAPSKNAISGLSTKKRLPILLNLHGAGLEADSNQVRHMLDSVPDLLSWVIFPTGVTPVRRFSDLTLPVGDYFSTCETCCRSKLSYFHSFYFPNTSRYSTYQLQLGKLTPKCVSGVVMIGVSLLSLRATGQCIDIGKIRGDSWT